jgi:hypothetical protein
VLEKGLSVRQVEEEVRRLTEVSRPQGTRAQSSFASEIVDEIKESFFGLLGVMPRVRGKGSGGVIELPFKDPEELQRLVRRLRS